MKTEIKLNSPGFFFVADIGLSKDKPNAEVDLTSKSDGFIATLLNSVLLGRLTSTASAKDLVGLIQDKALKAKMAKMASVELETEKEQDPAVVETVVEVVPEVEIEKDAVLSEEDVLSNLLSGGVKKAIESIGKANLSKSELETLLLLEQTGKDRAAVVTTIQELIG